MSRLLAWLPYLVLVSLLGFLLQPGFAWLLQQWFYSSLDRHGLWLLPWVLLFLRRSLHGTEPKPCSLSMFISLFSMGLLCMLLFTRFHAGLASLFLFLCLCLLVFLSFWQEKRRAILATLMLVLLLPSTAYYLNLPFASFLHTGVGFGLSLKVFLLLFLALCFSRRYQVAVLCLLLSPFLAWLCNLLADLPVAEFLQQSLGTAPLVFLSSLSLVVVCFVLCYRD